MKNLNISAISAAVLLLMASSCTTDNLREDSYISLNISSSSLETKATKNGEDPFNENIIDSVYYFFFKGGEKTSAPVVKGRLIGLDYKGGVRTEEIPVASGTAAALFESSEFCQVFIVANPPKTLETFLSGSPTLTELRTKLFQTSLDGIQDRFTMIFDELAAKEAPIDNIMTVEAKLKRLANKFTVTLNVSTKDKSTEWTSVPADAKVELHNAFKEASLGGDFATVKSGDTKFKEKYFNTTAVDFGAPVADGTDKWKCNTESPMYTYSLSWDYAGSQEPYLLIEMPWKNNASGEVKPTYYKVFLNTKELSCNNWYHLTVILESLGGSKEDPVQIFEDMKYLVLEWKGAFAPGTIPTADIDPARFLMMNQTEFWLYNQETWDFPYTTSHECEIVSETYEKMNYRDLNADLDEGDSPDLGDDYSCTLNGSLITFYHKLNNDLDSKHKETVNGEQINYGSYDVVPYTFKFIIKHKDDLTGTYQQEVIVHQYPAIYIEAQPNYEGETMTFPSNLNTTTFVNINNKLVANKTDYSPYYYGYGNDPHTMFPGIDQSLIGNKNGNMYVVTTSTAPSLEIKANGDATGKAYMLADPRKKEYVDSDELGIASEETGSTRPSYTGSFYIKASALYDDPGDGRVLKYYYPTRDSDAAENLIAPKLRVASSWGQTTSLTYDKALRRCAAYQEDGYPAGRWRLPTAAEVRYLVKLSSDHMIPMLFGSFSDDPDELSYYWCSTGFVGVYKSESSAGVAVDTYDDPVYTRGTSKANSVAGTVRLSVRCVYDEWYWENRDYNGTTKGRLPEAYWHTRYWGDIPRNL